MDTNDSNDPAANPMIGRRVGVYRLVEELGSGGMGVVYRAERADGEFDQVVAIKLIKRGMDTDAILRRFRRERQISASLNHPNIAYFYGGGSTEGGLPYFVMEYISGDTLYAHCDIHRMTVSQRIELMLQICNAVRSAHAINVVHRDIKPSNITVTPEHKPKLLDFGIAKLLEGDGADTEATAPHLRVMTAEYASPEQISAGISGPAGDIYSIGVILYELLSGHRPYRLDRSFPERSAAVVIENEPLRPSESLEHSELLFDASSNLEGIAAARSTSAEALRRELIGPVDNIIMKCLQKDPSRRYPSVEVLIRDLSSLLEDRDVTAETFISHYSMRNLDLPTPAAAASLAILPFKYLDSSVDEDESGELFLGIGLADSLISRLSGVARLTIRPTSSVIPFSDADPIQAARKLDVQYVLDGTVRRVGERIRISAQLLDVNEGSTRWAKTFDENIRNVLELEDSISAQVADELISHLTAEEKERLEKRGTSDPEALAAYMRARFHWSKFTDADLQRAVEHYREAIRLDPFYALPYIGIGEYYIWSAIFGVMPSSIGFPEAQAAVKKAIEIDDSFGEAYALLAFSTFFGDWDWDGCEFLITRALELNPNYGFAHECYSNFLMAQGRTDEAIREIKLAEALDPVSQRSILMTAWMLYHARDFTAAAAKARQAVEMRSDSPQACLHLGNILIELGNLDEAVEYLRRSAEIWPLSGLPRYMLAHARRGQGNIEAVAKITEKLLETRHSGYMKPYFIAMCFVASGDLDTAFEWFEKAVDEKNEWLIWISCDPKLDPIRSDPRYDRLLRLIRSPLADRKEASTGENTGEKQRKIAVMPFNLIGSPAGEDYLAFGLADALTMRLSNVRRFIVRPTSSVLAYRERKDDLFDIGSDLKVDYLIDGNIRYFGPTVRVTVQLLGVHGHAAIWSQSFDETKVDVLELEDNISSQVIASLLPKLSGEDREQFARRGTDDPDAYEAYLHGRYFWNQLTPASYSKALESFTRASRLDPNYALPYSGITDFYCWASIFGLIPPREAMEQAGIAARKAVALAPDIPETHASLGLFLHIDQQWEAALASLEHAVSLNRNFPLVHEWLSAYFTSTGDFERGLAEMHTAGELEPLSTRPLLFSAWRYYHAGRPEDALRYSQEVLSLEPDSVQVNFQLSNIYFELGDLAAARQFADRTSLLAQGAPAPSFMRCFIAAAEGNLEEAEQIVRNFYNIAEKMYVPNWFLALSNIAIGAVERAFEHLSAAQEEKSSWMLWLGTEPKLKSIRSDPRFFELLRRTGNPILKRYLDKGGS